MSEDNGEEKERLDKNKPKKDGNGKFIEDKFVASKDRLMATAENNKDFELNVENYMLERDLMQKELGEKLIQAVKDFDHVQLATLLKGKAPVNYQDEETLATALHFAAGYGDRKALLILLKTNECDLLIKDGQGRLASTLSDIGGNDPATARLLTRMEKEQAIENGVDLSVFNYNL